jgi:2-polyprenyl-6-methoxyphenol hydroxylase-like FAD-dependent oxidoreductase
MNSPRPIEIVGGGLAGLALGIALRRAGVPVTLFEAGQYPRHRVCGEFIAGLRPETVEILGLAEHLTDACPKSEVAWFHESRPILRQTLPEPALALSRHTLDARLADAFVSAGGQLRTGERCELRAAPPGRVFATGRRRAASRWVGLKLHARALPLAADLEFHLGRHAYVGLCAVDGGRVNVCGLFRQQPGAAGGRTGALVAHLRASGLTQLAARLDEADICDDAHCAVAGVGFGRAGVARGRLELGDAFALIPPFTGNGMAMAFESAAEALPPLFAWSHGRLSWETSVRDTRERLQRRFRLRLASSAALHPLLLSPQSQPWIARAAGRGWLPLRPLYRALH